MPETEAPIKKCPNKGLLYQTLADNCSCCPEGFLLMKVRLEVVLE